MYDMKIRESVWHLFGADAIMVCVLKSKTEIWQSTMCLQFVQYRDYKAFNTQTGTNSVYWFQYTNALYAGGYCTTSNTLNMYSELVQ